MFFYLVHHIVHYWYPPQKSDAQKNVMTFVFGSILWWLFWSMLRTPHYQEALDRNPFTFVLRNNLSWLILIDLSTMAVLYKLYYKRSICNEVHEVLGVNKTTASKSQPDENKTETVESTTPEQMEPTKKDE